MYIKYCKKIKSLSSFIASNRAISIRQIKKPKTYKIINYYHLLNSFIYNKFTDLPVIFSIFEIICLPNINFLKFGTNSTTFDENLCLDMANTLAATSRIIPM